MLNEFTFLADIHRADDVRSLDVDQADESVLLELSLHLAATPLGPLYHRHVSPDRQLAVLVTELTKL